MIIFEKLLELHKRILINHLSVEKSALPGSYARHLALESFYKELTPLLDAFVESYMGKYDVIKIDSRQFFQDGVRSEDMIKEVAKDLENSNISESWLNSQVDEILKLMYITLYKLNNLK